MVKRKQAQRGQVTVELAVLFGVVVAALVFMAIYFQRGVQGGIRSNADSLGSQFSATGAWNQNTVSHQITNETNTLINTTQNQTVDYTQTLAP